MIFILFKALPKSALSESIGEKCLYFTKNKLALPGEFHIHYRILEWVMMIPFLGVSGGFLWKIPQPVAFYCCTKTKHKCAT